MLPARREVVVKIGCRWLEKQTGIDGARAADGATNVGVDLGSGTGQIGRGGKDGTVESWYVDTTQVGTHQPLWSLRTSSDAIRWTTSLEKKYLLSSLTQPAGNDDTGRTGTNYNYVPYSGSPWLRRLDGRGKGQAKSLKQKEGEV